GGVSNLKASDYAHIKEFINLPDKINHKQAQKELQAYLNAAKNILPYSAYSELVKNSEIYENLSKINKDYNIDMSKYAELAKSVSAYEYAKNADMLKLYDEENSLVNEILIKNANDSEIETIILSLAFEKFKRFMTNNATDSDYKYLTEFGLDYFGELWNKNTKSETFEKISKYIETYNAYYDANNRRNWEFANRIISGIDTRNPQSVTVAITGGFHTEELKQILLSKGVSVTVVTPKISTETKSAEQKYIKLFNEQIRAQIAEARLEAFALEGFITGKGVKDLINALSEIKRLHTRKVYGELSIENIFDQIIGIYNERNPSDIVSINEVKDDKDFSAVLTVKNKTHNIIIKATGEVEVSGDGKLAEIKNAAAGELIKFTGDKKPDKADGFTDYHSSLMGVVPQTASEANKRPTATLQVSDGYGEQDADAADFSPAAAADKLQVPSVSKIKAELLAIFAKDNNLSDEELRIITNKYEGKPWFQELFSGEYKIYGLTVKGIEKIDYIISNVNAPVSQKLIYFVAHNKITYKDLERIVNMYRHEPWLQKLFSGDYVIYHLTAEGIEKIRELIHVLGMEFTEGLVNFAEILKSQNIIKVQSYNKYLLFPESGFEKQLALTPLISKLPYMPSAFDKKETHIFTTPRTIINTESGAMSYIDKIFDSFTPQSGNGKSSFLDCNERALHLSNSVDNNDKLKIVLADVEKMIDIMKTINLGASNECQRKFDEFMDNIEGQDFAQTRDSLDRLINDIHQTGEDIFFDTVEKPVRDTNNIKEAGAYSYFSNFKGKSIKFINLSKSGEINPEILKTFEAVMASPYSVILDRIVLKNNTLFWSCKIGMHSVSLKADFSEKNRGISASFYEGGHSIGCRGRSEYMKIILEKFGFNVIKDDGENVESIGLKAKLNKDTGLNENDDLPYVLAQIILLFATSSPVNEILEGMTDGDGRINELVRNFFSGELFPVDNGVFGFLNSQKRYTKPQFGSVREELNPILDGLGLDKIPGKSEQEYDYNPQSATDKYFNEPLERAYAEGKVILNSYGQLEKNANYNAVAEMADDLLGDNAGKLFEAGPIINQIINKRYFKMREAGRFGGQHTLKTGYIQLENGDYLSLKMVESKGEMVKAAKVESVSDKGREILNSQRLIEILAREGYENLELESIIKSEQTSFINALKKEIVSTENSSVGALVMSEGRNEIFAGEILIDSDKDKIKKIIRDFPEMAKRIIWVVPYTTPNDMEILDKIGAVLTLGGGKNSHAAISMRERGKMAMALSRAVLQNGKIMMESVKPKGDARNINGIQAQDGEGVTITIKNHSKILMNSSLSTIELLSDKEDLKKYDYPTDTSAPAPIVKLQGERKAREPLEQLKITDIVKTFGELKDGDKSRNGSKGWNLAEMSKKVFKEEKTIPEGITVDRNGIRYYLGDKAAEFDRLSLEIREIIDNERLSYEKKREHIERLRNRIKELIRKTFENIEEEKQAKELIKTVLEKMKKLGIKISAVRSAGIGEDGQTHAFAGMGESRSKVHKENVSKAVAECFKSFYSDRAIEYMIRSGGLVEPALVIQDWADFAKSGVSMSDGDIITINGAYGEGEGIVSGIITPDNIVLRATNYKTGEYEIMEYETADKDYRIETNESGMSELKRVEKGRKKRIYGEKEIKEIVKAIGKIKKEFGFNPDTEFGFNEKGELKVVQARANTSAKERTEESIADETEIQQLTDMFKSDAAKLTEKELLILMSYAVSKEDNIFANEIKYAARERDQCNAYIHRLYLIYAYAIKDETPQIPVGRSSMQVIGNISQTAAMLAAA
ncbi:MAG: PEP-utilizing enzyme, partial [Endomicrobia bacterium]|nr:PEP-utilizing enzyme [Endomicrobiia bacterium]